jgi:hypothetical protein
MEADLDNPITLGQLTEIANDLVEEVTGRPPTPPTPSTPTGGNGGTRSTGEPGWQADPESLASRSAGS